MRIAKKAAGNHKFGWDDVVTVCRDRKAGIGLAEEPSIGLVAVESKPKLAPAAPQQTSGEAPSKVEQGARRVCDLCQKLGVGGH